MLQEEQCNACLFVCFFQASAAQQGTHPCAWTHLLELDAIDSERPLAGFDALEGLCAGAHQGVKLVNVVGHHGVKLVGFGGGG
jgi:hypothetical protein